MHTTTTRYECEVCQQVVCITCANKCHRSDPWRHDDSVSHHAHRLHSLGFVPDAHCACRKGACQALSVVDQREVEGYRYKPAPLDTSTVHVPLDEGSLLGDAVEHLACNSHEVWAHEKVKQVGAKLETAA